MDGHDPDFLLPLTGPGNIVSCTSHDPGNPWTTGA
jgi:hypothetical protein